MTKSTFFKYLPARLKPLGKPAVWIPLTVVTLAGAFAWEYHNHPEWFKPAPLTAIAPGSELTAEEAAQLSEFDTLDVLLNSAKAPEGTETVTSQINPDIPNQVEAQSDTQTAIDPATSSVRGENNPFDGSFEAYPIPGARTTGSSASISAAQSPLYSDAATSSPDASAGAVPSSGSDRFNFGDGLVNPAAPSTNSALSEALNRRDAARASEASSSAPDENEVSPSAVNGEGASRQPGIINSTNGSALPAANSVPGPFIRTTPQMSPPVGTTGYQPPASSSLPTFNVTPTQPTQNPYAPRSQPAQVTTPTTSLNNPIITPAPASVASPTAGSGTATPSGTLYTAPTSVQPNQGPAINPRR